MGLRKMATALPVAGVGTLGLIVVQGMTARRTIERLPEADGTDHTPGGSSEDLMHLVVVGDSVAAGVGIAHHRATVAGRLSTLLATDRGVRHTVIAKSGLTASGVRDLVDAHPELATADVVIISVGVNDAKGLHSTRRWCRELDALLLSVTTTAPAARVILLGVPDMAMFKRLPRPLRTVLGVRSRALEKAGRRIVAQHPDVTEVPLNSPGFRSIEDAFASDGFHPSVAVHDAMAVEIHGLLTR